MVSVKTSNMTAFLAVLRKIDTVPIELLQNVEYVTQLVASAGLAHASHDMYGPYREFMNAPDEMGAAQNPVEFATALVELSKTQVRSACEIGSYHGATAGLMCAYLRRFNPQFFIISIDIKRHPFVNSLCAYLPSIVFLEATSEIVKQQRFDLCFIDAEHSYKDVKKDYDNLGANCSITMLHDIDDCFVKMYPDGGVPRLWSEMAGTRRSIEIKDPRHANHFGIGLLF